MWAETIKLLSRSCSKYDVLVYQLNATVKLQNRKIKVAIVKKKYVVTLDMLLSDLVCCCTTVGLNLK